MGLPRHISNKLINMMNSFNDNQKRVLLFFKGFPTCFYKEIANYNYFGLCESKWLDKKGYVNASFLEEGKKDLLIKFLTNKTKVMWGFYEEFIALTELVNDIKSQFEGEILIIDNNLFDNNYPLDIDEKVLTKLSQYLNNEDMEDESRLEVYLKYYSSVIEYPDGKIGVSFINRHIEEGIRVVNFYEGTDINICNTKSSYRTIIAKNPEIFSIKNDLQNGVIINGIQIIIDGKREKNSIVPLISLLKMTESQFIVCYNDRFGDLKGDKWDTYLDILHNHWGNDKTFRMLKFYKNPDESNDLMDISQGQIISDIINQSEHALNGSDEFSDIFVTAPTGAGKSLLFQIPSIYLADKLDAVTIVITPLIALMRDQVEQLTNERGVESATFINSDITFDEKERRISRIKNGSFSIVYLSPELLLANALESIIGSRRVGLMVIDEAHLVTTWGRDFRADYWYLGGYIEKNRRLGKNKFPILCLTATAVYMGSEDMVDDTVKSLNLIKPKIYLGNVKREDISFSINFIEKGGIKGGFEEFKIDKANERIINSIVDGTKSIVYCPYTSQVEDIYNSLNLNYQKKVGKYYGSYNKFEKQEAQIKFKYGDYPVMICTKAFGMGVDIKDIQLVYHFAPTGNLADYVQEIGRAARDPDIKGIAMTDFTMKDMKYVRMLYGLSGLKQYQLRELVRKLYTIYKDKKSRNLLISPETFSYLFDEKDLENKVKSGLLLIANDLENKFLFPVLNVRPKSLFTKNFVNVPSEIELDFLHEYGEYAKLIENNSRRVIPSYNKNSDIFVYNSGNIYEINMSNLWEKHFNHLTFAQFKRNFFEGDLFRFPSEERLSARVKLLITYNDDFKLTCEKLKEYAEKISGIFARFKRKGTVFTKNDFRESFKSVLAGDIRNNELPNIILDIFVADIAQNIGFNQNVNKLKFIQERKAHNRDELVYRVMNSNFTTLKSYLVKLIAQCRPFDSFKTFSTYIAVNHNHRPDLIYLAILLELFGLASYEIIGGKNTEIFVRINDPIKLKRLSNKNYSNSILTDIERRRDRSQKVLTGFMLCNLSDHDRWNVIENYFLGRDEVVSRMLNL